MGTLIAEGRWTGVCGMGHLYAAAGVFYHFPGCLGNIHLYTVPGIPGKLCVVLKHSVPHFPFNFRDIACLTVEHDAAQCLYKNCNV